MVARNTSNVEAVGSSPTSGFELFVFDFRVSPTFLGLSYIFPGKLRAFTLSKFPEHGLSLDSATLIPRLRISMDGKEACRSSVHKFQVGVQQNQQGAPWQTYGSTQAWARSHPVD
jgi:hypothetical protein